MVSLKEIELPKMKKNEINQRNHSGKHHKRQKSAGENVNSTNERKKHQEKRYKALKKVSELPQGQSKRMVEPNKKDPSHTRVVYK